MQYYHPRHERRERLKLTGLFCPNCKQPIGIVENRTATAVVIWCRACDHWWSLFESDAKAH